jgi:ABC-type multidrug transport system ATPase subunit
LTDIFFLASVLTLYQAGNGIYNLFDKVLVIDEGEEIYYGPMMKARPFLESLGFYSNDGANVADYLTGATVPSERKIIQGFEASFPRTADDIQRIWKPSTTTPLQTKRNPD